MLFEIAIRPLLYTGLVALAFAPLEAVFPLHRTKRARFALDVALATIGAVVTQALVLGVSGVTMAGAERLGVAEGPLSSLSPWLAIPLGLVVFEVGGYAYHRMAHRVPALWRLHRLHHSSTSLDWLASFRQHPIEIALMTLAQNLPLVLLGLPLGSHAIVVLLLKINTVFVHSNLVTPRWLEPWIATPRFHHRHHDREAGTANYASLLPWLDRCFGTFDRAPAAAFGLSDASR